MKHHLALMNPFFMKKIFNGQKTIETRWTKTNRTPFRRIEEGEKIFFKEVGGNVKASATAQKVEFHKNNEIEPTINFFIKKNFQEIGFSSIEQLNEFLNEKKEINYLSIIWLEDVKKENFKVDPKKYAYRNGWVILNNILDIKYGQRNK